MKIGSSSAHSSLFVRLFVPALALILLGFFTLVPDSSSWSSPIQFRIGFFSSNPVAPSPNVTTSNASTTSSDMALVEKEESLGQDQEGLEFEDFDHDIVSSAPAPIRRYSKLEKIEASLARVRSSITEAASIRNLTSIHEDPEYVPRGPIYRNPNAFHRSYLEMERMFKIFVYKEGDPPLFHDGPCRSIYSSEGRFIHELEKGKLYTTTDPDEALVYFLPFSVVMMVQYLYEPGSHEIDAIGRTLVDYIDVVSGKYPFWNRSSGADHAMVSCHDWGPRTSGYVPYLFNNSIRVLCNANTSEGFNPSKDASFPEIHLLTGEITGLIGGPSPSRRPILAFFAGRHHGPIRELLLDQWKNKTQEIQVYDHLPDGLSYTSMLKSSKFCLCPSGYEVASPRVVEAIYSECVPVLISDGYVPPFSDVLNWNAFSIRVEVRDLHKLKDILMGISTRQYLRMQRRVKQVQRHFIANGPPRRYDVFHMTVHSIWLRRLNVRIKDQFH